MKGTIFGNHIARHSVHKGDSKVALYGYKHFEAGFVSKTGKTS